MKRVIASVMFLALMCGGALADNGGGGVAINATNFPDDVFRSYVSSKFDTDSNDVLSDEEIAAVTTIDVSSYGLYGSTRISSLQGVEYFTALTSLNCSNNRLTSLDVSKNTELRELSCSGNNHYDYSNGSRLVLTALDVSSNTKLASLSCSGNQLTTLDVSKNTALTSLSCGSNPLTALDLSNNTELRELSCYNNQLTALDLSNNTKLLRLFCYSNQLTTLSLSKNTGLMTLFCDSNQLATLDLSKNTALRSLSCESNQLTTLDLGNNTALESLYCSDNQLTAIDLSKNTALERLYCYDNPMMTLDVSKNTALTYLNCNGNRLTALDLSNNAKLKDLHCSVNQLTVLDLSKNTELTWVACYNNQLTSLDVSHNTELEWLYCNNNQLATLDVSNNTKLGYLECYSNRLAALDVSKNTISFLRCYAQAVSPLRITDTGNTSYPYQLNFGDYITSSAELAKISGVQGVDSNDARIPVTYANGIAMFASRPVRVNYYYDVGYDRTSYSGSVDYLTGRMDVTISDNPSQTPGNNADTPKSLSTEALDNIGRSLGTVSSSVSYIPQADMAAEQTPTPEITSEVSSKGYQIVSNQGSLVIPQSGSYAFPISVPYHFIGTRTAAKVYLARRGFSVGMVVNPSELPEDLVEAKIFTETGEEVTTLPETIIAAANLEVSGPTTFSTHLATKVESSSEFRGTTSGGGCNSGFAVLGLAAMVMLRKKSK